ncbi:MAG: patatin-like phospholipase family protein [Sulfurovaceae bacterium]
MNQYLKYQLYRQKLSGAKLFKLLILPLFFLLLIGCSAKIRHYSAPSATQYTQATVKGYNKDIRYWGGEYAKLNNEDLKRLMKNKALFHDVNILALSGGAEDGAYGAGFLNGWTKRGDRPQFMMVTGISTGALIAPFAFLGSRYDHVIKRFYTQSSTKNILSRVLLIGTTDLDAQRPVVWNITKIAMSGRKDAKKLIRKIMLASASIPGAFPPVLIDVTIDGKRYQEVHVDGSVTRQIFIYPRTLNIYEYENRLGIAPKKTFWLIRNTKIDPVYSPVSLSLRDIAERSISTLIKYQGRDNIYNIISIAKRDGFDVYITNVPKDFDKPLKELFDPEYMRALYDVGYKRGISKSAWQKTLK